jgi:hypothetical protein
MEFTVLLRTAEVDVLAFASATFHRSFVRRRLALVPLTRACADRPRRTVRPGSVVREGCARGLGKRSGWTGGILTSRSQRSPGRPGSLLVRRERPWISESGRSIRLPDTQCGCIGDQSVGSTPRLARQRRRRWDLSPAQMFSGELRNNPAQPTCPSPSPNAASARVEFQPPLQLHAIYPAADRRI